LGRWLGVSHCVGSDLCFWIVTDSGQVVLKTSVEHVTRDDYLNEDTKAKVKEFEEKLGERLDDSNFILQGEDGVNLKMLEDLDDEGIGTMMEDRITPTEEEYDDMIVEECPEANDEEALDKYLNMELRMGSRMDDERWGLVVNMQKVLVVNLSVMLMLTLSLIQENTKSNLAMGLLNDMPRMLLPKTCMHRSMMKVICFNCWMKSWIIRRMIQQLI
jgi:hypothetical protein